MDGSEDCWLPGPTLLFNFWRDTQCIGFHRCFICLLPLYQEFLFCSSLCTRSKYKWLVSYSLFNFAHESMIKSYLWKEFFWGGGGTPPCLSILGKYHKTWKYIFILQFLSHLDGCLYFILFFLVPILWSSFKIPQQGVKTSSKGFKNEKKPMVTATRELCDLHKIRQFLLAEETH